MTQDGGEVIQIAGILLGQPEVAAVGEIITDAGTTAEMAIKASEGNLTANEVVYEVGKKAVFKGLGRAADKAEDAGTLEKSANDILRGIEYSWESITDFVNDQFNEKNEE